MLKISSISAVIYFLEILNISINYKLKNKQNFYKIVQYSLTLFFSRDLNDHYPRQQQQQQCLLNTLAKIYFVRRH